MSNSIKLYTQNDCPYCTLMKRKLDEWGYGYDIINVSYDKDAKNFLKENGHRTVPQLYDGKVNLNAGIDTQDFTKRHLEIILLQENDGGVEMFG